MVLSSDHVTGETGATVTVKVSKNGGAFGAGGGSVAELEEGVYAYTPSAGDVDTLGPITFKATASGCDPFIVEGVIVAYDPYDAVRMGQSALPNAAPRANCGLPTTNGTKINQTVDLTAGQSIGISGDLSATMKTSVQTAADAAVTANTKIVAIEADTNEVQAELADGGRTDLLIDAIKAITDQINFSGTDVNANASVALTEGDISDIADGVAAAIKLTTGWTAGGTLTYAEVVKIIASAVAGKVIDKAGVAGTIQHLDVEDGVTAIFENVPSNTTSPYRDPTIL